MAKMGKSAFFIGKLVDGMITPRDSSSDGSAHGKIIDQIYRFDSYLILFNDIYLILYLCIEHVIKHVLCNFGNFQKRGLEGSQLGTLPMSGAQALSNLAWGSIDTEGGEWARATTEGQLVEGTVFWNPQAIDGFNGFI